MLAPVRRSVEAFPPPPVRADPRVHRSEPVDPARPTAPPAGWPAAGPPTDHRSATRRTDPATASRTAARPRATRTIRPFRPFRPGRTRLRTTLARRPPPGRADPRPTSPRRPPPGRADPRPTSRRRPPPGRADPRPTSRRRPPPGRADPRPTSRRRPPPGRADPWGRPVAGGGRTTRTRAGWRVRRPGRGFRRLRSIRARGVLRSGRCGGSRRGVVSVLRRQVDPRPLRAAGRCQPRRRAPPAGPRRRRSRERRRRSRERGAGRRWPVAVLAEAPASIGLGTASPPGSRPGPAGQPRSGVGMAIPITCPAGGARGPIGDEPVRDGNGPGDGGGGECGADEPVTVHVPTLGQLRHLQRGRRRVRLPELLPQRGQRRGDRHLQIRRVAGHRIPSGLGEGVGGDAGFHSRRHRAGHGQSKASKLPARARPRAEPAEQRLAPVLRLVDPPGVEQRRNPLGGQRRRQVARRRPRGCAVRSAEPGQPGGSSGGRGVGTTRPAMNRRSDQLDRRQSEGCVGLGHLRPRRTGVAQLRQHLTRGILHRAPGQCGPGVGPQQRRRRSGQNRHQQLPGPIRLLGADRDQGQLDPEPVAGGNGQRVLPPPPKPLQHGRSDRAAVTGRRPGVYRPPGRVQPAIAISGRLRRPEHVVGKLPGQIRPLPAQLPGHGEHVGRFGRCRESGRHIGPGSHRRQRVLLTCASNRSDQPAEGCPTALSRG